MQPYNEKFCSKEFIAMLDAVANGMNARRSNWPVGQFLRASPSEPNVIEVYHDNEFSSPEWISSVAEQTATDWEIFNIRSGGYTDCAACDGNGCDRCMTHIYE